MLKIASQNAALLGDENCIELRDRSHLYYKSIINYDLDITNISVASPQIRYIEVFDITNPPFNEQFYFVIIQCRDLMRLHNPIPEINANPFPLFGGRVLIKLCEFFAQNYKNFQV